ncbi:hypothetical protein [Nocardioides yefusunii]|uniref:Cell division protein FtsL n=1 Tax=Nocardioides yefusunii TaxID=2500546 RepID=A0ABW1QZP3_9ACTN|nr:hypothetical protein [Nocardioides yefusunii]
MSSAAEQLFARVSSIGEAAAERARLTVVPTSTPRPPRLPFLVLVSCITLLGVVGLLMFNTSLQQASFTEADLAERAAATADREETLKMELDDLRDPQRIAVEAAKMGMVIPSTPVFLTMDGQIVGTPTEATSEDALRITPKPQQVPAELRAQVRVVEVPANTAGD